MNRIPTWEEYMEVRVDGEKWSSSWYSLLQFTPHLFHHCGVPLSGPGGLVCENSPPENLPLTGTDVASHHLNYGFHQGISTEKESYYQILNSRQLISTRFFCSLEQWFPNPINLQIPSLWERNTNILIHTGIIWILIQSCREILMFQRNVLPLSSGLKHVRLVIGLVI